MKYECKNLYQLRHGDTVFDYGDIDLQLPPGESPMSIIELGNVVKINHDDNYFLYHDKADKKEKIRYVNSKEVPIIVGPR